MSVDQKVRDDNEGEHWIEVTKSDLPLSCPLSGKGVAHAHPRVYLPIEGSGKVKCYYCGTVYVLKDYDNG